MVVPPHRYRFGVFELDPRAGELRKEGRTVRLRGKPYDLLQYFLDHPGALVSRELLRQQLWSADTFVDFDHGLNAAVNRLRDALGDTAENPRFIQTVPRKGYRFIAPVSTGEEVPLVAADTARTAEAVDRPSPPAARASESVDISPPVRGDLGRRSLWAVTALAVLVASGAWLITRTRDPAASPPAGRLMMAVLPFENLSDDPAQAYLGVGITDELIAQLGALQPARLGVIARTTVEQYRRAGRSIREIGRELNVQYVLEGSVRREGARGRITARLIQVSDQTQLWAATYERDFRDTLLTEHEVALRVASSLAMSVLAAPASGRMPHPESYDHYLRGRYLRLQATEASLRRAQEHFEQAITLDPRYADAHAGLADALLTMGAPGWEIEAPGVLLERAKVAVDRALELDPRHAEAYAVRALIKLDLDRDPSGAERDIERALSLNPSLARAHQYSSSILTATGRFDEAITAAAAAQALDPLSPGTGTTLGFRHYYAGAYEPALAAFRDVLETAPGFGQAHLGLAQTLRELGRTDQSIQELEKAVASGGNSTYLEARLGHAYAVGGRIEAARQVLEQLRSQAERRYVSPFHFALIHAGLGDESAMFDALERAKQDRSGWLAWLGVEREFAPFASHRRFAALLAP